MKKLLSLVSLIAVLGILLSSCKEEDKVSGQQTSAVQDQATADAYFSDAGDMSTSAYNFPSQENLSKGRISSGGKFTLTFTIINDTRFNGAVLTLEASGTTVVPQGIITIDFGAGQTDPTGTVRKGKILVAYSGYRFTKDAYSITTFDGYSVNGVKVEGKRTITTTQTFTLSSTFIPFVVKDENGKVTFTDGSFITRSADHPCKWVLPTTTSKGQWIIEGNASGVSRDSKSYSFVITTPLLFKVECASTSGSIPSEGEATLTVDKVPIQLNYGSAGAACDKVIKINVAGITQDVTVN